MIEQLLADRDHARSGVLLIEGEPGIGKTALLEHAVRSAAGATVLRADGALPERDLHYGGLARLLRPVLHRVGALEPGASALLMGILGQRDASPVVVRDRFAPGSATLSLLAAAAEEGPLLVVVDDVHWMDEPSVEALGFVARRVYAEGIAMILTRRPDPETASLDQLPTMKLGGLGVDDARLLLERRGTHLPAGRLASLVEATGGNPLALLELPALLPEGEAAVVPPLEPLPIGTRLQQAYGRRFQELSPAGRDAALVAALLHDPDYHLLATAMTEIGCSTSDLAEMEDIGLLQLGAEGVQFRHPLVRSAIVHTSPPSTRRRCHAAVAHALSLSSHPKDAVRRAWHLAAAAQGLDAEAADLLSQIAGDASTVGGFGSASRAFERAAQLTADGPTRCARFLAAATAAYQAGQGELAEATLAAAARCVEGEALRFEIARLRGRLDTWQGRPRLAYERLRRAADEFDDADAAARLMLDAVVASAFSGDAYRTLEAARRAADLATGDDPDTKLVSRLAIGAGHLLCGELTEGLSCLGDDAPLLELAARSPDALAYVASVAYCRLLLDMHDESNFLTSAVVAVATNAGATAALPFPLSIQAHSHVRLGAWDAAAAKAHQAATMAEDTARNTDLAYARAVLALVAAGRGREEECRLLVADSSERATRAEAYVTLATCHSAAGLLELSLGRPDEAIEPLRRAESLCVERGLLALTHWQWAAELVEALVRAGRAAEAESAYGRLEAFATSTDQPIARALAARCRGLLAADSDFEAYFVEALMWHDKCRRPFEQARTRFCFGERLRRAKRKAVGREQLDQALTAFVRLGADTWAGRARAELEATGRVLAPGRRRRTANLTPQELQTALLAAEGLTNREVATKLFLSRKTVEYHLGHVYRKLDVNSREALRAVLEHEPGPVDSVR